MCFITISLEGLFLALTSVDSLKDLIDNLEWSVTLIELGSTFSDRIEKIYGV